MWIQRRLLTKAVSTCGQGEENPEFWFATQEGKMGLFDLASLGLLALAPQDPLLDMHITKHGYILALFFFFLAFYRLQLYLGQAKIGQNPAILTLCLVNNAYTCIKLYLDLLAGWKEQTR